MTVKTVAGPFTEVAAKDTAKQLGNQYTAYGVYRKDEEGYLTDEQDWFVEHDDSLPADKLFGYDINAFMARQYK